MPNQQKEYCCERFTYDSLFHYCPSSICNSVYAKKYRPFHCAPNNHLFYTCRTPLRKKDAGKHFRKASRRAAEKEAQSIEKKKEPSKKPKPLPSPRTQAEGTDAAKINIYPLFLEAQTKAVAPLLTQILEKLYGHLYTRAELEHLTTALKQAGSNLLHEKRKHSQSREISLHDLYPKEGALQNQLYQLLRGTKHYNLEKQEGYPPLSHFICLREEEKIGHFPTLSPVILQGLFGQESTQKILTKEHALRTQNKARQKSLTKAQLLEYIKNASTAELLEFKHPKMKKKDEFFKDEKTLITFNISQE